MLQSKLNGEVASVMERALYNNVLGVISLDGRSFFYEQPLLTHNYKRSDWFDRSCCPPNVTRLFNDLEEYVFILHRDALAITLFVGARYNKDNLHAHVTPGYPWLGKMSVEICSERSITMAIRKPAKKFECSVDYVENDGYLVMSPRLWNSIITLHYTITPHIIHPHPSVRETKDKIAIERGPFVYCLEQMDSPIPLNEVSISSNTTF